MKNATAEQRKRLALPRYWSMCNQFFPLICMIWLWLLFGKHTITLFYVENWSDLMHVSFVMHCIHWFGIYGLFFFFFCSSWCLRLRAYAIHGLYISNITREWRYANGRRLLESKRHSYIVNEHAFRLERWSSQFNRFDSDSFSFIWSVHCKISDSTWKTKEKWLNRRERKKATRIICERAMIFLNRKRRRIFTCYYCFPLIVMKIKQDLHTIHKISMQPHTHTHTRPIPLLDSFIQQKKKWSFTDKGVFNMMLIDTKIY